METQDQLQKEGIVNPLGLVPGDPYVGIRGDSSLRETATVRPRYTSTTDSVFTALAPSLCELVENRSSYRISIGFNNNVVRTASVFDPFREEIHAVENLCDRGYVNRHFPVVAYHTKEEIVRRIYDALDHAGILDLTPQYWRPILRNRNNAWAIADKHEAAYVVGTLHLLRQIPSYYLRNVTMCLVSGLVTAGFNCDGTQIIRISAYKAFLNENGVVPD
ncbi:MAG: hypothetical protein HZB57_10750 [Gammaproteobacteria bacterium]|nr:hypothetical protein [Gammaproteobacteria bacterium]